MNPSADALLELVARRIEVVERREASDCTLYRLPEPPCPRMGVAVFDGTVVWVGVYDEIGGLVGTVVAETEPAVAWATDLIGRCRERGQEVFLRSSRG